MIAVGKDFFLSWIRELSSVGDLFVVLKGSGTFDSMQAFPFHLYRALCANLLSKVLKAHDKIQLYFGFLKW